VFSLWIFERIGHGVSSLWKPERPGSCGVISAARAADAVTTTLAGFDAVLSRVPVPDGVSPRLAERLHWNADRLRAGDEIGQPGS